MLRQQGQHVSISAALFTGTMFRDLTARQASKVQIDPFFIGLARSTAKCHFLIMIGFTEKMGQLTDISA